MPADDPIDDRSEPRDDAPRARRRDPDDRHDDEDDDRWRPARHYDEDGYEITSNDHMWAIFAHVGVFVVGFFAPLIIFFAYADKSAFVKRHVKESLNHQITLIILVFTWMLVAALIGLVVGMAAQSAAAGFITGYGLFLLGAMALGIKNMVVIILATIATSKYQNYRYPLSIRLLG
jgi:uncharacterized Tic20 family protein